MITRGFTQVDVFTDTPGAGNPVAVVHDAVGLSSRDMAAFARWTNLSETTFLLPPTTAEADYRLRIFTPGGELPFAGHPTLGSCSAWLAAGGTPINPGTVVQECGAGLVSLRREGERLAFAAPPVTMTDVASDRLAAVTAAVGLTPGDVVAAQLLTNGPAWLTLWLTGADRVLAARPDHAALIGLDAMVGLAGPHRGTSQAAAIEVRAFAPTIGVPEDPVTGSLNASIAQWLIPGGTLPERYLATQGGAIERAGAIWLNRTDDGVTWVGGECRQVITGHLRF